MVSSAIGEGLNEALHNHSLSFIKELSDDDTDKYESDDKGQQTFDN